MDRLPPHPRGRGSPSPDTGSVAQRENAQIGWSCVGLEGGGGGGYNGVGRGLSPGVPSPRKEEYLK